MAALQTAWSLRNGTKDILNGTKDIIHLSCLYLAKDHILHYHNFNVLHMNHLFISQCSVCYAFRATLMVMMYLGDEHTCDSIHKRVDSLPHSRIFQQNRMPFKPPSYRASGNDAPLISGCLVLFGYIHHMTKLWLCKHPTSIVKFNHFCTGLCDWLEWNTLGSLFHRRHNWCRYDSRLSFWGLLQSS